MNFNKKDGLSGNEIISIQEDSKRNIWLATDQGISKFTLPAVVNKISKDSSYLQKIPDDFIYFYNYDKLDGLTQEKFMGHSILASDGTVYFAGTAGYNTFKPKSILKDTIQSPIQFIEFRLFNKVIKPQNDVFPESPLKESIEVSR